MYITNFQVEGTFRFPLDMLRYDGCYPASQQDVAKMGRKLERASLDDIQAEPIIELTHCGDRRTWQPTAALWESFGWRVVSVGAAVRS